MVYSASAVQAHVQVPVPSLFMYKQLAWAVVGVAAHVRHHARRLSPVSQPGLIWSLLGVTRVLLVAGFLFAPRSTARNAGSRSACSRCSRRNSPSSPRSCFTAALLDRRMHRVNDFMYALAPIAARRRWPAGPDLQRAGLRYDHRRSSSSGRHDAFAAGLSYRYLFGLAWCSLPAAPVLVARAVPDQARDRVSGPGRISSVTGFRSFSRCCAFGSGGIFGKGPDAAASRSSTTCPSRTPISSTPSSPRNSA